MRLRSPTFRTRPPTWSRTRLALLVAALLPVFWVGGTGPVLAGSVKPALTHNGAAPADPDWIKFYVHEEGEDDPRHYLAWGNATRSARIVDGTYDIHVRFRAGFVERNKWFKGVEVAGSVALGANFDVPLAELTVDALRSGQRLDPFTTRVAVYSAGKRGKPIGRSRAGQAMTLRPGRTTSKCRRAAPMDRRRSG